MPNTSSPLFPLILLCLGSILIGGSAVFVRFSDLGALPTGFYRMLFSLPLLALWMQWDKREGVSHHELFRKGKIEIVLAGFFFALNLVLWNYSVRYTTVVNSTLLNNTAAFFVPLTLWIIFREKPSFRIICAASIGFLGSAFLVGESFSISYDNLLGDIISLFTGLLISFYLVALKQVRAKSSTGFLMFWTACCATFFLWLFSYCGGGSLWPVTGKGLLSGLGQAVFVQVFGQGLIAYSLGKISATSASIVLFLAPLTSAVLGLVVYGENLSHFKLFGMAFIMLSIVFMREKKTP
jgi:drug/metabolite transporter (DMT)-like permease